MTEPYLSQIVSSGNLGTALILPLLFLLELAVDKNRSREIRIGRKWIALGLPVVFALCQMPFYVHLNVVFTISFIIYRFELIEGFLADRMRGGS